MATLRALAEQVIESFGLPYNGVLYERAKDLILQETATFIRQSSERNGIDDYFLSSYLAELAPVDVIDNCQVALGCTVLRTINKIPEAVRIKNDTPFTFVGTADGARVFRYTRPFEKNLLKHLRFTSKGLAYMYINRYIYILNSNIIKWVRIDAPYVVPFSQSCNNNCYNDDMEFPCSADMTNAILKSVIGSGILMKVTPEQSTVPVTKTE